MVERIKELCKERGTCLRQLEIETGLANGSVARWDNSSPSAEKVRRVAEFFGVTCDYIIRGEAAGASPRPTETARGEVRR